MLKTKLAQTLIKNGQEDSFFIIDLASVRSQFFRWNKNLPNVKPFFAVKCCPDPKIMQELAKLGCGFDVASKEEVRLAYEIFGSELANEAIYANPCKQVSHIREAKKLGIDTYTFDNIDELRKVYKEHPEAKLVVRILGDDSKSFCGFNEKFGIAVSDLSPLLKEAANLGANVIGVAFHVGSGCQSAEPFVGAIRNALEAFELFPACGLPQPSLLDLGGGWPGELAEGTITFEEIAEAIRPLLAELDPRITVIAEPGRYFAHAAGTVVANVISKRDDESRIRYYINNGVYSSFSCLLNDHPRAITPSQIFDPNGNLRRGSKKERASSLWGSTCDGIDCIAKSIYLPELSAGSWLMFENMGAYSIACSSNFNGFEKPRILYINE